MSHLCRFSYLWVAIRCSAYDTNWKGVQQGVQQECSNKQRTFSSVFSGLDLDRWLQYREMPA